MRRPCAIAVAAVLLLALPPLFGAGSRAHAGFVGVSLDGPADAEAPRWAVLVQEFLTAPDLTPTRPTTSGHAPGQPGLPAPKPPAPREQASHGEGGATGATPPPSGGPSALVFHLDGDPAVLPLTRAGLLYLTDSAFVPDPSASRLFRPPRV